MPAGLRRLAALGCERWTLSTLEPTLLDREQLETLATIVAEGSFERAAILLNVSKGAISQRIKALEETLATVLLIRERPVVATPAGELLLRHAQALRLSEQATLNVLRRPTDPGAFVSVAVAVNADSLATWLPTALWALLEQHRIAIEVVADDQAHTIGRLVRGEVIGCVSTERKAPSGFVALPLGVMEYRCYATPDFAARYFPNGLSVQSVLPAPAVVFNRKDTLHDQFLQAVFGFPIERYRRHYLPAPATLLQSLVNGVAYGLVPVMQAQALVDECRLVDLAPGHPIAVELFWHHWEHQPSLSIDVTKHLLSQAAQLLQQQACSTATPSAPPGA